MPTAIRNPPNPWEELDVDWDGEAPPARLEIYEEEAASILGGKVPGTKAAAQSKREWAFRYSVNPYRGCFHGCAYCYARTSHQYLGFGAGTDFERKLVVKTNAVELLRNLFEKKSWQGNTLMFSGNTDCYQPIEASYRLTRGMLELCALYQNPVSIITKSTILLRDLDVLMELHRKTALCITFSISFASDEMGRKIEPWAPLISKRFAAMKKLSEAGIRTGVSLCPIIPGLNDADLPSILKQAKDAGAQFTFANLVKLPSAVNAVFEERMHEVVPLRSKKIMRALAEMRPPQDLPMTMQMNPREMNKRLRDHGEGERWSSLYQLFERTAAKLGFEDRLESQQMIEPEVSTFRRPSEESSKTHGAQLSLF